MRFLRFKKAHDMDFETSEAANVWAGKLLIKQGVPSEPLTHLKGWSNHVWLAPAHVLRLSSGRFRASLKHEAKIEAFAANHINMPHIVSTGSIGGQEWMISDRVPGASLLGQWLSMERPERREAVRQLAHQLKVLHDLALPCDLENPWLKDAVTIPGKSGDAYRIPPQHYPAITQNLRTKDLMDETLLAEAEKFLKERLALFETDQDVLIHGDPHFNNLIWDGKTLTLLDFEVATRAPRDRELQTLIDFCADPQEFLPSSTSPYGVENTAAIGPKDMGDVMDWFKEDYPELLRRQT